MSSIETIYDRLHSRLINGGFSHGQRLRAEKLRLDYGCSASTLREVLFRLSTVGLVDFEEQRGFRLPKKSPELQHELTQMRILLETEGACLSIRLGGVAWEARLSAAHHMLSHIESKVPQGNVPYDLLALWSMAELNFHQTLIDACGSGVLKRTHGIIYHQFRQQLIATDRDFIFVPENIEQHKSILDAALDHDEGLIRKCIHDHLARNLISPMPEVDIEPA